MNQRRLFRALVCTLVFAGFGWSTAAFAQVSQVLPKAQTLYLPIYSHMLYGNLGKRGAASYILLSALVSIRNTDPHRPLRILSAAYYDTHGKLLEERVAKPVQLPPLGTHEVFVELNDASGGSGANFIVKWEADQPINPPLVEAIHANMDGGKAVIFKTQALPIVD